MLYVQSVNEIVLVYEYVKETYKACKGTNNTWR
jgi:hypothetical protein